MPRQRWLIPAFGVTLTTTYGTLYYAIAILARPIQAEMGWSGGLTVGAFSVALLIAGLCAYATGRIIDQHGGRQVMTAGSALAGILLLALSQVETLFGYYAVWAGIGVALAMTQYEAAFAVVVATFPQAYRNRLGTLMLAGGLASTIFWPVTHALVAHVGWRGATAVLGAFTLAVCVPLHWYAVPRAAARESRAAATPTLPEQLTPGLRKILRRPVFWFLALSYTAFAFVTAAMALHSIPILESRGIDAVAAVSLAALVGPMQIAVRLADVSLNGRLPAFVLGAITVLAFPLGLALLLPAAQFPALLYGFVVLYGAGLGLITLTRATTTAEIFGRSRYGAISGVLSAPSALARAAGPVTAAAVLTAFHDYDTLLAVLLGTAAVGALCYATAVTLHNRSG